MKTKKINGEVWIHIDEYEELLNRFNKMIYGSQVHVKNLGKSLDKLQQAI